MRKFLPLLLLFSFISYPSPSYPTLKYEKYKDIRFNVYRNDRLIGYHKINFDFKENIIKTDIEIKFEVKFLGFLVYDYFHKNRETWENNSLIKLSSITDKNGDNLNCNLKKEGSQFVLDGTLSKDILDISPLPTSYWNIEMIKHSNMKILNTQDCSFIDFKIKFLGEKVIYNNLPTNHYKLIGKESTGESVDIDIWYDKSKEWVKMIFIKDDSAIEYILDKYDKKN